MMLSAIVILLVFKKGATEVSDRPLSCQIQQANAIGTLLRDLEEGANQRTLNTLIIVSPPPSVP